MENTPPLPSTRAQRVLAFLGGQKAPPATTGVGRRVLYRCPNCQRIWYQDGPKIHLDLDASEQARLVQELSAHLEALPPATCRVCLWREARGVVEIDEYGSKDGDGKGFGFSWEAPEPIGAHLMAAIVSCSWLGQQTRLESDIVTSPRRLRAVLHWFVKTTHLPPAHASLGSREPDPGAGEPSRLWHERHRRLAMERRNLPASLPTLAG